MSPDGGGESTSGLVEELLALACRLAVTAGDLAAAGRRDGMAIGTKSTATDLVTAHDRAAELVIVEGLAAGRPADSIKGEEGTNRDGPSGVTWFLDPIDGTTNFVYDVPQWATSVAAGDASGMLAGAVYLPTSGELFAAGRGRGATLDGRPIHCSRIETPALALVATGFAYTPERRRRQALILTELIGEVRDVRRIGAASVDLCYVAAGRVDAYFEEHLNPWDIAAGALIATEAGCRTGDYAGGPGEPDQLLVANPVLFDRLSTLLSAAADQTSRPAADRA